jgi:histidine kinase
LFKRFFRVDKSRSRASGGSGIGLTIARHFIEAQGGQIWAASEGLGEGATFTFTLPLTD